MSLRQKTIHGSLWSVSSSIVSLLVQSGFSIIMARLLFPADFGLFGMAVVFIPFLQLFIGCGIGTALIQKEDLTEDHLHSIFWVNIGIGFLQALIFIVSIPLIAWLFKDERLLPILSAVSLCFIIVPLQTIPGLLLARQMRFKELALIQMGTITLGGLLGVFLALWGQGVWALAWSLISGMLLSALITIAVAKYVPKFVFHWVKTKELLGFGLYNFGFGAVNYFVWGAQNFLIGRFLGATALGYYQVANRVILLPLEHITWRVSRVLFPALSKIQGDLSRVRDAYLRACFLISAISFPALLGLIVVAPELVTTLLGSKWTPTILLIQVLSVSAAFQSIGSIAGTVFNSQGRADLLFKLGMLNFTVIGLFIIIGLAKGLLGIAIGLATAMLLLSPVTIWFSCRMIGLKNSTFYKNLWPSFCSASAMFLVLSGAKKATTILSPSFSPVFLLVGALLFGAVLYVFLLYFLFRSRFFEIINLIREIIRMKKNRPPIDSVPPLL